MISKRASTKKDLVLKRTRTKKDLVPKRATAKREWSQMAQTESILYRKVPDQNENQHSKGLFVYEVNLREQHTYKNPGSPLY